MVTFSSYALSKQMVDALRQLGYVRATPIQEEVIPKILRNENVIGKAETGSGKTHAFLIPIVDRLDVTGGLQAIILSPTRELARQTYEFSKQLRPYFPKLKMTLATGGRELDILTHSNVPHLLITTPGRLDKLAQNSSINLYDVKTIVIDEADMLLDAGFIPIIDQFITKTTNPQLLAFSATLPKNLESFIKKFLDANFFIDSGEGLPNPTRVSHHLVDITGLEIEQAVSTFIDVKKPYLLLVFASRVKLVINIYEYLKEQGYQVGLIHGDLTMRQRQSMFKRIKANKFPIIVASDLAARGIDISDISDVLSVDIPPQSEYYLHRAGRTGRYDRHGDSYLFTKDIDKSLSILSPYQIKFQFKVLKKDELAQLKRRSDRQKPAIASDGKLQSDIKKAIYQSKTKHVKPGYKKKVSDAIAKVKQKHRRRVIKQKIREQLGDQFRIQKKEKRR